MKRQSTRLLGVVLACGLPSLVGTSSARAEPPAVAASADAGAPVRLLVLGSVPEFVARVRGQVSDLDVLIELDTSPAGALRAELDAALIELAARHDADVIAWLGEAPDDANASGVSPKDVRRGAAQAVHVWVTARRQVYSRRIGPPHTSNPSLPQPVGSSHPSALDTRPLAVPSSERSATLETAALVVRGAVRSVSFERGGAVDSVGEASTAIDASPPIAASEEAPPAAPIAVITTARSTSVGSLEDQQDSASAFPKRSSVPPDWAAHAGLDWTYAGLSRFGALSLDAGLALRLQRLRLGVGGSYGFPEVVQYENLRLQLRRQTLLAEVGWEVLSLPRFALVPTFQIGAARFTRSTSTSAPDRLAVAPSEFSVSALASFELVIQYELIGALRLSAGAGVGYLSHVPRYLLGGPGEQTLPLLEAWRWQPNAGLALGAVF